MSEFVMPKAAQEFFAGLGVEAKSAHASLVDVYRRGVALIDGDRPVFCDCDKPRPTLLSGVGAAIEKWSGGAIVAGTFSSAWSLFVWDVKAFRAVPTIFRFSKVLSGLRTADKAARAADSAERSAVDRVTRSDGKLTLEQARVLVADAAKSASDAGAQAKSLDDVASAIRAAVKAGVTQGELAARIGRELRALGVASSPPSLKVAVA